MCQRHAAPTRPDGATYAKTQRRLHGPVPGTGAHSVTEPGRDPRARTCAARAADRFFHAVVRKPRKVIAAIAVTTLLLGWQARKVELNNSIAALLPSGHPSVLQDREVKDVFDSREMIFIGVASDEGADRAAVSTLRADSGLRIDPPMAWAPRDDAGLRELAAAVFDSWT